MNEANLGVYVSLALPPPPAPRVPPYSGVVDTPVYDYAAVRGAFKAATFMASACAIKAVVGARAECDWVSPVRALGTSHRYVIVFQDMLLQIQVLWCACSVVALLYVRACMCKQHVDITMMQCPVVLFGLLPNPPQVVQLYWVCYHDCSVQEVILRRQLISTT
jgi:hypothetical protein